MILLALVPLAFILGVLSCGSSDGDGSDPLLDASSSDGNGDRNDAEADAQVVIDGSDAAASDANDGGGVASACPSDTTLLELRTSCPGTPLTAPASLINALTDAGAGDVIGLGGMEEGKAPCLPVALCTPFDAPTLLFSDSPEAPLQDGVLYADVAAKGLHRFYVYHANGAVSARKFPIVVLNQGAQPATITILKRGLAAPSKAYVSLGKTVLLDWLTTKAPIVVTIPAGQRVLLDPALDALHAEKDELVHAIYDVDVSAPVKVSFVSVLANADAAATTGSLTLLSRDANHQRGTFPKATILVKLLAASSAPGNNPGGVHHLRFGGNEVDATLAGIDAPTGDAQKLLGNYGLLYRVVGLESAKDPSQPATATTHAAIGPRGGTWGGALRITGQGGVALATNVALPKNAEVLGSTTEAIALGNMGDVSELSLMTAGGSNLPVDLFFVTAP